MSDPAAPELEEVTLEAIPKTAWQLLEAGARRAADPLHTACIATVAKGRPKVRTVVLRHVEPEQRCLGCHTNTRAAKVAELRATPQMSWHFYDRARKLQLVLSGSAVIHTDDGFADTCWTNSTDSAQACYNRTDLPGDAVSEPPPAPVRVDATTEAAARSQFAVVRCHIDSLEWLYLTNEGHRRARFSWDGGECSGTWITP